ncbi:ABC transporter ATP-binding protein [Streptomyces tanashiensis]|uniref:ATP-binding cassette domain-containing protein n=1 Tax=Streptomyces tanashiensis TaxID=67367 RepID=A0ABY6R934_9ACTN|nr:ATP-binding cassette domain-containing protein [Streptomyces tanashiensis]UZX26122.1 ATP-binding cassette domain-containing protein [Streptomyces tanashiensis]
MPTLIRAEGLTKYYRRPRRYEGAFGGLRTLITRQYDEVRAVDGVDFTVSDGELVGYLGPNGAGKSTTIKMMTGVLVPTSGLIEVDGTAPWRDREKNAMHIGVVFGQRSQLWWDLPLVDSFTLLGKMYRMSEADYRRRLDGFIDLLDLGPFLDRPVRQLSLGQRMRGDLAAAMLHEPSILYLDEPTIGLDAVARDRMRDFIAEMNRESGTTIVLTTHDLVDVEALCNRVVFIDKGRVLYDGSVVDLKATYAPHRTLVVQLASGFTAARAAELLGPEVPGAVIADEEPTLRIRFEANRISAQEIISAVTSRCPVTDLSIVEPELEDVMRTLYGNRTIAV